MTRVRKNDQFTIAGMLFITLGFAIFCSVVPSLNRLSRMSPSWPVCVAILLMFAWVMIPLRTGAKRTWWIGFLICGCAYLAIAMATMPAIVANLAASGFREVPAVFGILAFTIGLLPACGIPGGVIFAAVHRRIENRHVEVDCGRSDRESAT